MVCPTLPGVSPGRRRTPAQKGPKGARQNRRLRQSNRELERAVRRFGT